MSKGGSCHKFLPAVAGKHELRTLAQIDEPPYDVIQQSAQRGPLGDTWYNHLDSFEQTSPMSRFLPAQMSSTDADRTIIEEKNGDFV